MYVSRQKPRLEAAKVLLARPRLNVLMPRLGLNVMTSKLRYISLFITFTQSSGVCI